MNLASRWFFGRKTSLGFKTGIMVYGLRFFLAIFLGFVISLPVFAQNKVVEKIPFNVNGGHLIIKIRLNDSGPLNFIFDSGAGATLISRDVADSIGLVSGAQRKNVGVSGEHKVSLIRGVKLSTDNTKLAEINVLSTQTFFEELDNGAKVHGVIGYDVLISYVAEIDNKNNQIVLYDESGYEYKGEGDKLPIYLVQNLPITNAIITTYSGTEIEGQFMIDSGSRSELIISSPTVVQYDLADNIGKHYTIRSSIGTSSRRTKMRYGRLAKLKLLEFEFEDIPVALSSDNKGVLSMDFIDGIIGNKLLQRFNLVFDYGRSIIYLEAGDSINSEYSINLTGFTLTFQAAQPIIKNLVERSPADKAGLRNGDQIISINGVLVENMSSGEIREAFTKKGETLALVIMRNNKFKYTEFRPKPMI